MAGGAKQLKMLALIVDVHIASESEFNAAGRTSVMNTPDHPIHQAAVMWPPSELRQTEICAAHIAQNPLARLLSFSMLYQWVVSACRTRR